MSKRKKNNVAFLQTDFAKEQYANQVQKQRQVVFLRRRTAAILVIAAIGFLSAGVSLFHDFSRLSTLGTYKEKTVTEQRSVKKEVDSLKKDVHQLEDDDYVAKLARSRYFYSKDGEINFKLPDSDTDKSDKSD